MMRRVDLSALPDRGARLQRQLAELTSRISRLDVKIREDSKAAGVRIETKQVPNSAPSQAVQKPQPQRSVSGQVLPANVKQTKLTDHVYPSYQSMLQHVYAGKLLTCLSCKFCSWERGPLLSVVFSAAATAELVRREDDASANSTSGFCDGRSAGRSASVEHYFYASERYLIANNV